MKIFLKNTSRIFTLALVPALVPALAPVLGLAWMLAFGVSQTQAQEATEWKTSEFARTRFITSHKAYGPRNSPLYIGWEIELKKGWKTYWRSPGDAGLPTTFDFEGSFNLARTEVFYPAPERFELFGIQTFGYEKHLILPILISPTKGGEPIDINVAANFMVCKDICILLDEAYSLSIKGNEFSAEEGKYLVPITKSVRAVPTSKKSFLDKLALENVEVRGVLGNQTLVVDVKGYNHLAGADLIIEAENDFHFGAPKKALRGTGKDMRFVVPIGNMSNEAANFNFIGQTIKLTVLDGWGNAIERSVTVRK